MRLTLLHRTEAHSEGVWSTAWIPNSNRLVTGSVDESVKVWEDGQDALEVKHTYEGHTLGVVSVAVHAAGQVAASSALDSVIRVWDLVDHSTKAVIETAPTETWSLAFGPQLDELFLATAGGTRNAVVLWKIGEETSQMNELQLPTSTAADQAGGHKRERERFVLSVAYSPDGMRLAAGCMDGTVALYDVVSGALQTTLAGHYKPVRSLAFTPDSKLLLTACDDMHVNMYDVHNGALVESFSGHESWVLSVAVHPTGQAFASGSSDSHVKLWDLATRQCVQTCKDHTDQVWSVSFNSTGTKLASVSDDKSVATYGYA